MSLKRRRTKFVYLVHMIGQPILSFIPRGVELRANEETRLSVVNLMLTLGISTTFLDLVLVPSIKC